MFYLSSLQCDIESDGDKVRAFSSLSGIQNIGIGGKYSNVQYIVLAFQWDTEYREEEEKCLNKYSSIVFIYLLGFTYLL